MFKKNQTRQTQIKLGYNWLESEFEKTNFSQ